MNIRTFLDQAITQAMHAAGAPAETRAHVRPSAKKAFGDYQANGIMGAAKLVGCPPRALAEKVLEQLDAPFAERIEVAGPGFLNIFLNSGWLADQVLKAAASDRLNIEMTEKPTTVVIDYSSPNLAKEMHVGHLRSTIIGDACARILEFLGNPVLRQNHVGDWGTQFGMLIGYLRSLTSTSQGDVNPESLPELADLEKFYKDAKQKFDCDADFADQARREVVRLQSGDPQSRQVWQRFIEISLHHCEEVYQKLGVLLRREHVRAESDYNAELAGIVDDLQQRGFVVEDQGAQCVFLDQFKGKNDKPLPIILQKADGGYLYMSTDLAALRYRYHQLKGQRILYVVDKRQALHFNQLFTLARKAEYIDNGCSPEHVEFGMVLGKDGRPFKTRSGENIKLKQLLDEACERAYTLVSEKNPDIPESERRHIGEVVGVAAVKYADLSKHRSSDYVFDWEQMLALEGNTAPYLLYAYARIASILRNATDQQASLDAALQDLTFHAEPERMLALKIVQLHEVLDACARECLPHYLCSYLYELAGAFMTFYEACPILKAESQVLRTHRLCLAKATAQTLAQGFELLGITPLERM